MAKEEEAKVEEVKVVVVVEVDVLVWIGARQRGRSSTLQDARPAPTSDRGMQGMPTCSIWPHRDSNVGDTWGLV